MNKKIMVTLNDHHRLMELIEMTPVRKEMTDRLAESLTDAKLLRPEDIAGSVVTMNTRVRLKDLRSRREAEITITYPQDAEPREMRVSIFSEIGLALLGREEGDIVSWRIPNGTGRFEIDRVLYQPEASGDYAR